MTELHISVSVEFGTYLACTPSLVVDDLILEVIKEDVSDAELPLADMDTG